MGISGQPQEDDYSSHHDGPALSDLSPRKRGPPCGVAQHLGHKLRAGKGIGNKQASKQLDVQLHRWKQDPVTLLLTGKTGNGFFPCCPLSLPCRRMRTLSIGFSQMNGVLDAMQSLRT